MVSSIQHSAVKADYRLEALIFAGLGLSLAGYYFSPQLWLTVPLALAFLALSVLRLDLAIIYVLFTAPFYLFPKNFGDMAFSLTEFTTLACFAALIIKNLKWPLSMKRLNIHRQSAAFYFPVIALAIAAILSLAISEYPKYSLREFRTTIVEPLLFYIVLVSLNLDRRGIWRMVDSFVLVGACVAAFAIYHYYFVGVVEATGGVRRVLAIYHSPNALALFLGRIAPLTILLATTIGRIEARRHFQLLYIAASFLIGFALFITYSRGAWLAVAIALAIMLILWTCTNGRSMALAALKWVVPGLLVFLALLWLLSQYLPALNVARILSEASNLERLYVWQAAVAMIRDHPIFGVGLDNFLYHYPKYMLPAAWAEPEISHPHNMFLDFWLRLGLLGLISWFGLQLRFWRSGWRLLRKGIDKEVALLALALMGTMADVIFHGLIDNSFFLIDLAVVFWFVYGIMQITEREATS